MKKNQNKAVELEILKATVGRNKIKNTGERIDDIISTLKKEGILIHSVNR